jgi:hypothetical protein
MPVHLALSNFYCLLSSISTYYVQLDILLYILTRNSALTGYPISFRISFQGLTHTSTRVFARPGLRLSSLKFFEVYRPTSGTHLFDGTAAHVSCKEMDGKLLLVHLTLYMEDFYGSRRACVHEETINRCEVAQPRLQCKHSSIWGFFSFPRALLSSFIHFSNPVS